METIEKAQRTSRRIIASSPCGTGKTLLAMQLMWNARQRGETCAFLAPRRELLRQACAKLDQWAAFGYGVIQSSERGQQNLYLPIQVASVDTLVSRVIKRKRLVMPPIRNVYVDECFVAGTMVGDIAIESVKVGDRVPSLNHTTGSVEYRTVLATSRKIAVELVSIDFSNGQSFTCTTNHPIFCDGIGYCAAGLLSPGVEVLTHEGLAGQLPPLRQAGRVHPQIPSAPLVFRAEPWPCLLQSAVQGDCSFQGTERDVPEIPGQWRQGSILAPDEGAQPDAAAIRPTQALCDITQDWTSTKGARRQWSASSGSATDACASFGMADRSGCEHGTGQEEWLSEALQNRHCERTEQDCCRGQWQQSSRPAVGAGQAQDRLPSITRVARVRVHKSAGAGGLPELCPDGYVYNLEVEGNNNYFANGILVHNCHLYTTVLRSQLMDLFPDSNIIGFTATPGRHDGRALSINFEKLLEITTVKQAIRDGFLVPSWHKAPSRPDLANMKKVAADYNAKELDERMEPLMGGIVESWLRFGADRRTLVFANNVARSVWLAEQFRAAGVAAEHCDGDADDTHRDGIFDRLRSGETQVMCNCDLAIYGFDLPAVACIVNAKPTLSVVKYIQMLGRGARRDPLNGKKDFLVLDHAGAVYEHGYYEDDRHWTLAGIKSLTSTKSSKRTGKRKDKVLSLRCKKCATVFTGALTCPDCGYFFERAAERFHVVDGELVEVRKDEVDQGEIEKRLFHAELLGYAAGRGYKPGWAAYAYQSKYKAMPPDEWRWDKPVTPSITTERYLKYLTIRRARARKKVS